PVRGHFCDLGRCHAGADFRGDMQNRSFHLGTNFESRMQDLSKDFDAGDETWAGARKITVGGERVYAIVADGRDRIPLLGEGHAAILVSSLLSTIATRSDHQNIWSGLDDVLQGHAERGRTRGAERVYSPGAVNHLGNPMTADVERLQPLEEGDARPLESAGD